MSSMLTMNGTCNCVHVYVQYTVLRIIEKYFQLQLYLIRILIKIDWPAKIATANLGGPVKRKIK